MQRYKTSFGGIFTNTLDANTVASVAVKVAASNLPSSKLLTPRPSKILAVFTDETGEEVA